MKILDNVHHLIWSSAVLVAAVALLPAAAQEAPPPPPPALAGPAPPAPLAPPAQAAPWAFAFGGAQGPVAVSVPGGGSYLGVDVTEITAERAKALKLREEAGVELTRVAEDSPAVKAGLKAGDVVLEYNGQRVDGTEQFVRLVRETPVGRQVKLLISRNGATQTITATTGKRPGVSWRGPDMRNLERDMERLHKEMNHLDEMRIYIPDMFRANMSWRSPALGVEGESLEGQLAGYFGVQQGVLVRSVLKGTSAEKAGVKAGDVILKVDDARVASTREISSAIRSLAAKKTFPLQVRRNQKEMTLSVTLDEAPRERRFSPRPRVVVQEEPRL